MKLQNKKVAILAADGFEESELFQPLERLKSEGADVEIVSLKEGEIKAMKDHQWSKSIKVDKTVDSVNGSDYNALVLPGGVLNPDALRTNDNAVKFVSHFLEVCKPLSVICHGPQTMIETKMLEGRKMTSVKAVKTDLENAGVNWVDQEVVVDNGLVSSRTPKDLPAFLDKMVEEIKEGKH